MRRSCRVPLQPSRGFTLAEIMVVSVILGLLLLIGLFLYQFANRTQLKAEKENLSFRQGSLAVSRLRRSLRGTEVTSHSSKLSDSVIFRYPKVVNDRLAVDAKGRPIWEDKARIYQKDTQLLLEKPIGSDPKLLAELYNGSFAVTSDLSFIYFKIEVQQPGASEPGFSRQFRLAHGRAGGSGKSPLSGL